MKKLNKQDKDWIFSKINTLKEIRYGIESTLENTLENTNLYISRSMVLWINNFIREITEKTKV